jgi:site-specific recombinase XerD
MNQNATQASTTTHRFSILFWLDKRRLKSPTDPAPIFVRITIDGKRADISTKRNIVPNLWNSEKGLVKGQTNDARSINHYIEQIRTQLFEIYREMLAKHQLVTTEAIKNKYLGIDEKQHTLLGLVAYHNTEMKNTLEPGTLKNYFTTEKYLKRFLKEKYKTNDLYLSQLNYKFVTDYEHWLKSLKPEGNLPGCNNNTTMKHIERVRKMIGVAMRNEWLEKDPFQKYRLSFNRVTRDCLTDEELNRLENLELNNVRLDQVRDLFVFSCYTGLAYSDVSQLTQADLNRDLEGNHWLYTNRQKTNTTIKVPLLPKAQVILDKYRDRADLVRAGRLLPIISNQKVNSYLKELAEKIGTEKNLTFHLARHTFATTVTLTNGVPIETVSKMLGHTSIRTTQIYAKVVEQKLVEDMKRLQERLANKKEVIPAKIRKVG